MTAPASWERRNMRISNKLNVFDEIYDLVDKLPSDFFGDGMTIADMETWIRKMKCLLATAKNQATIHQNDDTTPLE